MVVPVRKYPDLILRRKAEPVEKISQEIFSLVENMIETMIRCDGVGLAANQVGSLLRIFTINSTPHEDTPTPLVVINPKILSQEGRVIDDEGCLSLPELYLKIPRSEKISIQAHNIYNERFMLDVQGLLARAIQHEIDHLNGVLIIDHVGETDKEKLKEYLNGVLHTS
jgi:peptide deformylase